VSPVVCEGKVPKYKNDDEGKAECVIDCFPDECHEIDGWAPILVLILGLVLIGIGGFNIFKTFRTEEAGLSWKAEIAPVVAAFVALGIAGIIALVSPIYWICIVAALVYVVFAFGYMDIAKAKAA